MEETIGKVGNFHFFGWPRFDTVRLGEWMTGMIHEPVYMGGKTAKHGVEVSDTTYVFSRMQLLKNPWVFNKTHGESQMEKVGSSRKIPFGSR